MELLNTKFQIMASVDYEDVVQSLSVWKKDVYEIYSMDMTWIKRV